MKNNVKFQRSTVLAIILAIVLVIVLAFLINAELELAGIKGIESIEGVEGIEADTGKYDEASFVAGVFAGMDFFSMDTLQQQGSISDEAYQELLEVLEEYFQNPSRENEDNWRNCYLQKLEDIT